MAETVIRLNLPIKFKVKDADDFKKKAVEYFKEHRKLKPVVFGFSTDYAESLEYGTGPLSLYQPTVHHGNYTRETIYKALYDWAGRKEGDGLPIEDEEERARFAERITNRFFNVGMKQHPYWRPAVQWLEDNEQRLFDEGKSLYEIADEALRNVALKYIKDQNIIFDGQLILSSYVKSVGWSELGDAKDLKDYNDDERNRLFKEVGWM